MFRRAHSRVASFRTRVQPETEWPSPVQDLVR